MFAENEDSGFKVGQYVNDYTTQHNRNWTKSEKTGTINVCVLDIE